MPSTYSAVCHVSIKLEEGGKKQTNTLKKKKVKCIYSQQVHLKEFTSQISFSSSVAKLKMKDCSVPQNL